MTFARTALGVWILLSSFAPLHAFDSAKSGYAKSDNFTVLTPKQATAQEADQYATAVLQTAELQRREIAREWLGQELPPTRGRTIVTVSFAADRDAGLTWAIDDPRRKYHALYLSTSPDLALGSTLAHEMVHVVLATQFPHPNRLPAWLEEGIASQYDDGDRKHERQQQLATFIRTRTWPPITDILSAKSIPATDTQAYTLAAAVTAMLLARDGDKQKLLAFGQYGNNRGWDIALQEYYGIAGVDQLQKLCQRWMRQ